MEKGHSYDFIMSLDMVSLYRLMEGSQRVEAARKIDSAWTAMIAAQGQSKNLKDWLKPQSDLLKSEKDDAEAFKKRFGKGI